MSDTGKEARTRTISWEDPRALAEAGQDLSGLEYLRKIVAGELPRPFKAANPMTELRRSLIFPRGASRAMTFRS